MNEATLPARRADRCSVLPTPDHRLAVGAVLTVILASTVALSAGGSTVIVLIGALLLGVVGLAAAAL